MVSQSARGANEISRTRRECVLQDDPIYQKVNYTSSADKNVIKKKATNTSPKTTMYPHMMKMLWMRKMKPFMKTIIRRGSSDHTSDEDEPANEGVDTFKKQADEPRSSKYDRQIKEVNRMA